MKNIVLSDDYDRAKRWCKRYEDSSNVETDVEESLGKRQCHRPKRYDCDAGGK